MCCKRLDDAALETLLAKAEAYEGRALPLTPEAREAMIAMADGDGRYVLVAGRDPVQHRRGRAALDRRAWAGVLQKRSPAYDKDREEHYNLISALHKSVRGSDPDAALYWLARMLDGGEDPLFIARRLVRMASRGHRRGRSHCRWSSRSRPRTPTTSWARPEGELALAQVCVHLAAAPKSNAVYTAFGAATRLAQGDRLADAAGPYPQRARPG